MILSEKDLIKLFDDFYQVLKYIRYGINYSYFV